jgi:hypothetical protein
MTNVVMDYSKLVKGQRYIFQRKKISEFLQEKTFEAHFESVQNVNNKVRILLSNYVDKDVNTTPQTMVSMPVNMIDYIIKHPSMSFETNSFDSIDSDDSISSIDLTKGFKLNTGQNDISTNTNSYSNRYMNTDANKDNEPCEEESDEYYVDINIDYENDDQPFTDNKENISISEMERYSRFIQED